MKQRLPLLMFLVGVALLSGCATTMPVGALYTEVQLPITATEASGSGSKVGTATCTSILSLLATGDCSINAAAKSGGITKIHHVDWQARNILGLYGEYHVSVHGD